MYMLLLNSDKPARRLLFYFTQFNTYERLLTCDGYNWKERSPPQYSQ